MPVIPMEFGAKSAIEEAVDRHPVGKAVPSSRRALLDARKWAARIDIAREGYAEALAECRRLGVSNVEIARMVGKSEAAIRLHFKRRDAS